jgi:hypothetical protein
VIYQVGITVGINVSERLLSKQSTSVRKKNCCEEQKCDTEMCWIYRRYLSRDCSLVRVGAKGNVWRTQMKPGLKWQVLTTPDGMLFHLFGPFEGRRHDMHLYAESGLGDVLAEIF